MSVTSSKKQVKGVVLLSGGLDSTLAAKVVKDLGVEVFAVHFAMPWRTKPQTNAQKAAKSLGIHLVSLQLDENYLRMLKKPKYGYGSAFNPCIDCHTYMIAEAGRYMHKIGADFVFTGEVVGQRPMSQLKQNLRSVEKWSGIEGRLLRPLSARLLEPTLPEKEGLIDRNKLLDLSGRSRKKQIELAKQFGITDYPTPAGGCRLTDGPFGQRMKDILEHGYRDYRETISLKWGRHFRINENFRAIIGRDKRENEFLTKYAYPQDHVLELPEDKSGPTLILIGNNPSKDILETAAGLVQKFSHYQNEVELEVMGWLKQDQNNRLKIKSHPLDEATLERMRIG